MMDSRPFTHLGEVFYYIAVTVFSVKQFSVGNNLAVGAAMLCSWSLYKNGGTYPRSDLWSCLVRVICFGGATGVLTYISEFAAYPLAASTVAFGVSAWIEWSNGRHISLQWEAHPDFVRDKVAKHGRISYHVYQDIHDNWLAAVSVGRVQMDTLQSWSSRVEAMADAQHDFDKRRRDRSAADVGFNMATRST